MSQPESADLGGLDELRNRRDRRRRVAPPPRHPKPEPSTEVPAPTVEDEPTSPSPSAEISQEIEHEIAHETRHAGEQPVMPAPPPTPAPEPVVVVQPRTAAASAPSSAPTARRPAAVAVGETPLPSLDADLSDPALMMYAPTVLNIAGGIMRRFDVARQREASHTAVVLNALRGHARELPDLVLAARPGPRPGDLFPYRAVPGQAAHDRKEPLRIRPTAGELRIMDALTTWVTGEISRRRPGGPKVSRSEVVAAALDAYLPKAPPRPPKPSKTPTD
jgi:hypothetical protein